jgi:hypothetical protein
MLEAGAGATTICVVTSGKTGGASTIIIIR